jgi:hypothetical protein
MTWVNSDNLFFYKKVKILDNLNEILFFHVNFRKMMLYFFFSFQFCLETTYLNEILFKDDFESKKFLMTKTK